MDPLLFHIEWDVMVEALFTIIVLSFFVERALALVFEHRLYLRYLKDRGLKEFLAFGLAYVVVSYCDFDALTILLRREGSAFIGYLVTAAVIAGGSKACIKLFHDVVGARSSTVDRIKQYEAEGMDPKAATRRALNVVESPPRARN
jgi:hypothetical protein